MVAVGPNVKRKTNPQRTGKRSAERARPPMPSATPTDTRVPSGERHGQKVRATFHLSVELLDEVRDAVVALSGPPDRLSMMDFAESAFRREVERLKRVHLAAGKAFGRRAEPVRRGRPIK